MSDYTVMFINLSSPPPISFAPHLLPQWIEIAIVIIPPGPAFRSCHYLLISSCSGSIYTLHKAYFRYHYISHHSRFLLQGLFKFNSCPRRRNNFYFYISLSLLRRHRLSLDLETGEWQQHQKCKDSKMCGRSRWRSTSFL